MKAKAALASAGVISALYGVLIIFVWLLSRADDEDPYIGAYGYYPTVTGGGEKMDRDKQKRGDYDWRDHSGRGRGRVVEIVDSLLTKAVDAASRTAGRIQNADRARRGLPPRNGK